MHTTKAGKLGGPVGSIPNKDIKTTLALAACLVSFSALMDGCQGYQHHFTKKSQKQPDSSFKA